MNPVNCMHHHHLHKMSFMAAAEKYLHSGKITCALPIMRFSLFDLLTKVLLVYTFLVTKIFL